MKRLVFFVTLVIFGLSSCAPAQTVPTSIALPTTSPQPAATKTLTQIPQPTVIPEPPATEEAEKFVPNTESLTIFPGKNNDMGGKVGLDVGADWFYQEAVSSILEGDASTFYFETDSNGNNKRVDISNDQFFLEDLGVNTENPEEFIEALKNSKESPDDQVGYFVPRIILPLEPGFKKAGADLVQLRVAENVHLDTIGIQLLDDDPKTGFVSRQLDSSSPDYLSSQDFQMAYVWATDTTPAKGVGYFYGIRVEVFPDGCRRLVLLLATENSLPWDEIGGKRPPNPEAIAHLEQWLMFYPFLFKNMNNFPSSQGAELNINMSDIGRAWSLSELITNYEEGVNIHWDGDFDRLQPSYRQILKSPN